MASGYIQVATDGAGKKVANVAVVLPAGTAVVDAAGDYSVLTADEAVFVQMVTLVDADGNPVNVINRQKNIEELLALILAELQKKA